jgi:hypothetical protein
MAGLIFKMGIFEHRERQTEWNNSVKTEDGRLMSITHEAQSYWKLEEKTRADPPWSLHGNMALPCLNLNLWPP